VATVCPDFGVCLIDRIWGRVLNYRLVFNAGTLTMDRLDLYTRLWLIWCAVLIVGLGYVLLKISS